jgi:hypothetical protein
MPDINRLPVKSTAITALLAMVCLLKTMGQTNTDFRYCSREYYLIQSALNPDTAHLSFQAMFCICYSNSDKDTVNFSYKISKNKIWMWSGDSIQVVQNNYYNLVLYTAQQRAVVSRPQKPAKYWLHANLPDFSFYQLFISGAAVTDSGSLRKLCYSFKTGSPYQQYDIVYDTLTHRINCLRFRVNLDVSNTTSAQPYNVTVHFSNYQTGGFNDSVFSTTPYFMRKQGICYMVPPYTNYQLINSLNQ